MIPRKEKSQYCTTSVFRITQIKTYSWDNAQVILVGNKCDMEHERVVSRERGATLAAQLGVEFYEASAKENINVKVRVQSLTAIKKSLRLLLPFWLMGDAGYWVLQAVFERLVDIICDKMSESLDADANMMGNQSSGTKLTDTGNSKAGQCCS